MTLRVLRPTWPAPPTVRAAVTTRSGGSSTGIYDSFNLATHVGDDPTRVSANRQLLRAHLGMEEEPMWLEQVHGTDVVDVDDLAPPTRPPRGDAAVARRPGKACVIMTADCLPVLLCASDGSVVAAAHAGWRGLAGGVLERTVERMQSNGDIMAWLGPGISGEVYEVGNEVRQALEPDRPTCSTVFKATRKGHWLADLAALARIRLEQCGVREVYGGNLCSYSDERFYSYRRDSATGRMASLIWIADGENARVETPSRYAT